MVKVEEKLCAECHDVHGAAGTFVAMTKGNKEGLCRLCHVGQAGHAIGVTFGKDSKTYSLECTSCHNVHIITGMYSATDPGKSPVTKLSNNLVVWGNESGEKMDDFAGGGTYRIPKGDTLSGSQLPDYPSFCLDCHGVPQSEFGPHGGISWGSDDPHGLNSANVPNGGGTCPDRYTCGKATADWPKLPRGRGEQIWSRNPYSQEERIAGANFVLSCSDCHVTHESGIGSKLRNTVNGGPGSVIHNTMCNNCHYYYSTWHEGMSCGNAGCHGAGGNNPRFDNTNTIHGMDRRTGDGSTRIFNRDLVLDMRFNGNLNDSGTFRLHGDWAPDSAPGGGSKLIGSFATGHDGAPNSAIQINGHFVEPGTRNNVWSNHGGYHGTHVYFEMKYNLSVETWIYPTTYDRNVHVIMSNGPSNSNYRLELTKMGSDHYLGFQVNVNGDELQADSYGWRGAYSTVPIPLNQWTHVAATYDASKYGDDFNSADLSEGRIRIYVNGQDVTTNRAPNTNNYWYTQPGDGEGEGEPPLNGSGLFVESDETCGTPPNEYPCGWRFVIGSRPYESSPDDFKGRIDDVKIWNITKDTAYFDMQIPPSITKVEGIAGYDRLYVEFSEGVYANTNGTGDLQPSDFSLNSDGKTINSIIHTAGETTATLILSAPLNESGDIGVDTLAAAGSAVYDEYGDIPAFTDAVTITTLPSTEITSVEGIAGGSKLKVNFSHWVFANSDKTGALNAGDFVLTDVNNDNSRGISAVQHSAGDSFAIITMDAPLISADITVDTVAAAGSSIFNSVGYPIGMTPITITGLAAPTITTVEGLIGSDQIVVYFSEGVYTDPGQSGTLQASDFILTDADNSRGVISVTHTAGTAAAILTLSSALDSSNDIGVDSLAAAGNAIYNRLDVAIGTSSVTITGNNCPAAVARFDFNEPAGSATVTDNSGLLIGQVGYPGFSMLGDGLYTGDPTETELTYIDVDNNNLCLKSPRALTLESRFFMGNVDLDYVDISPANGIDDDYDAGGPFSKDGDGRNTTATRIAERKRTFQFTIMRANWAGDQVAAQAGKSRVMLKYRVTDRGYCDGTYPGDPTVGNGAWMKQISSD